MGTLTIVLIIYLLCGLLFLASMYQFNPKMRQRIKDAPYDLFNKLAQKGSYASLKIIKAVMYPAIWLFWVFIIIGMVQGKYEGNNRKHRVNKGN